MLRAHRSRGSRGRQPPDDRLAARLRECRLAAGLTQAELAGDRFSKEYVSQIERAKTRPTDETVQWLASRLGVDPGFLRSGVSAEQRDRLEAALARADALVASDGSSEAIGTYRDVRAQAAANGLAEVALRTLIGEARARFDTHDVQTAADLLVEARELSERPEFSDIQRAEVLLGLGACRFQLSSISTAIALLDEAIVLAERSGLPADQLRARILHWRSRCHRHQRDYEAAKADVEHALELARGVDDPSAVGALYFQASLLADREGHYVLARTYAERAKAQYEELADRTNVGRLLNNLGGLYHRLGNAEQAIAHLKQSFATALDLGHQADAAQAISSLARVNLDLGDIGAAEDQARQALDLLGEREDYMSEIGSAQVVLGRALMEQNRLDEADEVLRDADRSFEILASIGHRASAWIARGDVASRRGEDRTAARLYRQAAEALQDVRF